MRYKVLVLGVVFSLSAILAEAVVFRSSVGNRTARRFTLSVSLSSTALIHLIYDNRNSDLDITLAAPDGSGQLQIIASSESTIRQFEQMEVGILGQLQYTIIVLSSQGPSPFRLNVDASLALGAGRDTAPGAAANIVEVREAEFDAASLKLLEQIRKRQKDIKERFR